MDADRSQDQSLTRTALVRLILVVPIAAAAFFLLVPALFYIGKAIFGASLPPLPFLWITAVPVGGSAVIGALIAPTQFRRKAALALSALFLVAAVGFYLWEAAHGVTTGRSLFDLIAVTIGLYLFVRPFAMIDWMKTGGKAEFRPLVVAIFLITVFTSVGLLVGLSLILPPQWAAIIMAGLLFNIIEFACHCVGWKKIGGVSFILFVVGKTAKWSPLGVVLAFVAGGAVAVAGRPDLAPYAAIIGFMAFTAIFLWVFARRYSTAESAVNRPRFW